MFPTITTGGGLATADTPGFNLEGSTWQSTGRVLAGHARWATCIPDSIWLAEQDAQLFGEDMLRTFPGMRAAGTLVDITPAAFTASSDDTQAAAAPAASCQALVKVSASLCIVQPISED